MKLDTCACGCSLTTTVTNAEKGCTCGCDCCAKEPQTVDEEIAQLLALRSTIDGRLAELSAKVA